MRRPARCGRQSVKEGGRWGIVQARFDGLPITAVEVVVLGAMDADDIDGHYRRCEGKWGGGCGRPHLVRSWWNPCGGDVARGGCIGEIMGDRVGWCPRGIGDRNTCLRGAFQISGAKERYGKSGEANERSDVPDLPSRPQTLPLEVEISY